MTIKFNSILNASKNIKPKKFDTHGIFHVKCGKPVYNYDYIQENNVDTEIYPTLKKYGTLKPMEANLNAIYGEIEKMDLMELHNRQIAADNMWNELPLELRQKFNNDKLEFLEKGPKWLEEQIKQQNAAAQPIQEPVNEPKEEENK